MQFGPIDLTPFGALLTGISASYWMAMVATAALALWLPRRWWAKAAAATAVLSVFIIPISRRIDEQQNKIHAAQSRITESMAHYELRCRQAGERVSRTAQGVDGLVWLKWRDRSINHGDQFKLDDPFGWECGEEECIKELLRIGKGLRLKTDAARRHERGYLFVETTDPRDGKLYRYTGQMKPWPSWTPEGIEEYRRKTGRDLDPNSYTFTLEREPIDAYSVQYGVTWEDISTRVDREHWVAGGSLKIIDLRTNEVVGERIGYMIDRGQGSTDGFRSPWLFAKDTACPALVDSDGQPTRIGFTLRFLQRVLQPTFTN